MGNPDRADNIPCQNDILPLTSGVASNRAILLTVIKKERVSVNVENPEIVNIENAKHEEN
ncbi:MAG: hypothetical protein AAGU17_10770 [Anaerolineaceae bacterium]